MSALFQSGGFLLIAIFLCAFSSLVIIVERLRYFSSLAKGEQTFKAELDALLAKRDYAGASKRCEEAESPLARVLGKVIECRNVSESALREIAAAETGSVVPRLERFLPALGVMAPVAVLLGLLGTAIGYIRAFGGLASGISSGIPTDTGAISAGIAGALVTTAAGIIAALPSVIFFVYFRSCVKRVQAEMDVAVTMVILRITRGLSA